MKSIQIVSIFLSHIFLSGLFPSLVASICEDAP